MTVADLRDRVSGDEFTRWAVYFGRKEQRHQLAALKAKTRGR
jgi:hypothetical protein